MNYTKETIEYGKALVNPLKDGQYSTKSMEMVLYKQSQRADNKKHPLLIVVFAGGFVAGSPNDNFTPDIASYFQKKGFIVCCPNYRLVKDNGLVPSKWNDYSQTNILSDTNNKIAESENLSPQVRNAAFTAVRDVKSCIRHLTKNTEKYGIDKNNVFMMGQSAGALITMATAFSPKDSFFKDDLDYITKDTTLKYNNPDITPFNIKAFTAVSGSNQIIEQYKQVYNIPNIYANTIKEPNYSFPTMLVIHSIDDPVVLIKRSKAIVDQYDINNQSQNMTALFLNNDFHVPLFMNVKYNNKSIIDYIYKYITDKLTESTEIVKKTEGQINTPKATTLSENVTVTEEQINTPKATTLSENVITEKEYSESTEDDQKSIYILLTLIIILIIIMVILFFTK